jgi:hypothetical protein
MKMTSITGLVAAILLCGVCVARAVDFRTPGTPSLHGVLPNNSATAGVRSSGTGAFGIYHPAFGPAGRAAPEPVSFVVIGSALISVYAFRRRRASDIGYIVSKRLRTVRMDDTGDANRDI